MVRVAVSGACGRMGRMLTRLAFEGGETELVAALESHGHPDIGKDAGVGAGIGDIGVSVAEELAVEADVVIDFSSPEGSLSRLEECEKKGVSLVVGTTGLGDDFMKKIESASKKVACLVAPNMSVGMNVLFGTVGRIARSLGPDYDIEIVEMHHNKKKDAPSGSALKLAEAIQNEVGSMDIVHGREGAVGERKKGELGMHAVRGGEIVGDHTVFYAGPGERVEVTHRAQSRETFAAGAMRAAVFVASAKPGLYTMADVLGLEE